MDLPTWLATDRRSALRTVLGASAAGLALPLMEGAPLSATAQAQGYSGVAGGKGDVVYIPAASVASVPLAEWDDAKAPTGPNRIAQGQQNVDKAPSTASRYEAKTFEFPTGTFRVLTYKKGAPVMHQLTFETELLILQGWVTLNPIRGLKGTPTKLVAGDALFMPSGILTNPKPTEDTILLQAMVGSTSKDPKSSIVFGKSVKETHRVEWQQDGKDMSADRPEEMKKAGPGAVHLYTKRYVFDGNSIRYATLKKGGRTGNVTNNRVDVIIYMVKGHMRRKEGDQTFELKAGDATREKKGNGGYWEVLEDSVFVATDAPLVVGRPMPA